MSSELIFIHEERVLGILIRRDAYLSLVKYTKDGIDYEVWIDNDDYDFWEDTGIDTD